MIDAGSKMKHLYDTYRRQEGDANGDRETTGRWTGGMAIYQEVS
jgi:hypothetical protein